MKILIVLVLLISIINASKYVNFQPFSNTGCKGPSGIGYSILLDECISFDQNTTYIFNNNNMKQIGWSKYSKYNGDDTCNQTPVSQGTFKNNACVKNANIAFDTNSLPITNGFYKISVTNEPIIPESNYIKSYMSGDCTSSNVVMLETYTNGTKTVNQPTGIPYSYYCDYQNQPYNYTCSIWGCFPHDTGVNCQSVQPFTNSSSDYYQSIYCN